ncbi:MAG: ABC-F family ATP-binding cassette domain-containing protein [Actinomycetota bacterium]
MPGQLSLRHCSVSLAGRTLLHDVSLTVGPRTRLGLLGPNGVGKSTLLRVGAGLRMPDEGSVERSPADVTVGYLEQEPLAGQDETLLEMLARRTGVAAAQRSADRLLAAMGEDLDRIQQYAEALTRLETLGGYDLEARGARVSHELGLPADALRRSVSMLSGGQRARAALAAIALARFDVLLLDEPTNDLDLDALAQLERFVTRFSGGIVVVSHDRAFLDACVDRFVELDPFTRTATEFTGSWGEYERSRERRRAQQREAHDRASAQRARLLARARAMRDQASRGTEKIKKSGDPSKAIRFAKTQRAEGRGSKAVTLHKRAERIEIVDAPREPWVLRMDLTPRERGGDQVVQLAGIVVQRGTFRLGPIDLDVRRGDRLAIQGANGSGKSTLLGALLGEIPLASGWRRVGAATVFGTLRQDRAALAGSQPLLSVFEEAAGLAGADARALLATFDLAGGDVVRPCDELSPGERTRAMLAILMARRVNCLVLDEPTNHLDIPAIEELERSLAAFDGTLVLATHDRRLLERAGIGRTLEL